MVGRVLAHGPIFCKAPDVFGVAMVLHWRIFGFHDRLDHAVPYLCHLFVCHLTHISHSKCCFSSCFARHSSFDAEESFRKNWTPDLLWIFGCVLDGDGDDAKIRDFLFTFQNGAAPLASSFKRPFFYAGKVFAHCHLDVFRIMAMVSVLHFFGLSVVVVASGWIQGEQCRHTYSCIQIRELWGGRCKESFSVHSYIVSRVGLHCSRTSCCWYQNLHISALR